MSTALVRQRRLPARPAADGRLDRGLAAEHQRVVIQEGRGLGALAALAEEVDGGALVVLPRDVLARRLQRAAELVAVEPAAHEDEAGRVRPGARGGPARDHDVVHVPLRVDAGPGLQVGEGVGPEGMAAGVVRVELAGDHPADVQADHETGVGGQDQAFAGMGPTAARAGDM
jgi:hypothetical protein